MLRNITALFSVIALLSLPGCVNFSTQTLDLHPEIMTSRDLPKDLRVEIKTKDLRKDPVIARLPGKKGETADIVLKDPHQLLHHSAEHALEDMGVSRFYYGGFVMTLSLKHMSYETTRKNLQNQVDLQMKLRVQVKKGDKEYNGNYSTHNQHFFVKTPSAKDNEEIITKLVSDTLSRAFNDVALLDFMQFNQ